MTGFEALSFHILNLDASYVVGTTKFSREALKYFVLRKGGNLDEQLQ